MTLGYKTMYRYKIMLSSKLQQWPATGNVDMAPKPEIITFLELWQIASKFPRQIRDFRWCRGRQRISHNDDCDNNRLPEIARLASKTSILQFPVVGCCCNRPGLVSASWAWSKTRDMPLELQWYLSYCGRCKYFRFRWLHCNFRWSFNVAFMCRHFLWLWRGWKLCLPH